VASVATPAITRPEASFDPTVDRATLVPRLKQSVADARDGVFARLDSATAAIHAVHAVHAVHAWSGYVDDLVRAAYRYLLADRTVAKPPALLALGGFGRRELCPFSDIDLLLVHDGAAPDEATMSTVEDLVPLLWDVGLAPAQGVRAVGQAFEGLEGDLVTATSLLEARFVAGDPGLFARFRSASDQWLAQHARHYVARRVEDARQRHGFYGGSPAVKEPNVKESPGGLRDVHALVWLDRAVRVLFGVQDRALFPWEAAEGSSRVADLLESYGFLLGVRTTLHRLAERKNDRLELSQWESVAQALRFDDGAELLGVERFMRRYHLRARVVVEALERLLDEVARLEERSRGSVPTVLRRRVGPGFVSMQGRLYPAADDVFQKDPVRLLEAFLLAQRLRLRPSDKLVSLARRDVDDLAARLRDDPRSGPLFLSVFEGRGNVADALRGMHRAGVLEALLPEFSDVTCLSRFEPYHQFTVDEHSLRAVGEIDALDRGEGDAGKRAVLDRVMREDLLKLGVFLHDIGKSKGHGHIEKGLLLLPDLFERLGLCGEDARTVMFLVREHLLMSRTSQRQDPTDSEVTRSFAERVKTRERLRLLYLLTVADTTATAKGLFSRWVDVLLTRLFERTDALLSGALLQAEVEDAADRAGPPVSEQAARHLDAMPARYSVEVWPEDIAVHLTLAARVEGGAVAAVALDRADGLDRVWIAAHDRRGLFALFTGALSIAGLDIVGADAYTRRDGLAFDRFVVQATQRSMLSVERVQATVVDVLEGRVDPLVELSRAAYFDVADDEDVAADVTFDARRTPGRMAVEIEARDRPGLLFELSRVLAEAGEDILFARVVTKGRRVDDTFHVRIDPAHQAPDEKREILKRALLSAARKDDPDTDGNQEERKSCTSRLR